MQEQGILAVMVGNAVTEFGMFEGGQMTASWQLSTPERLTVDEARLQLAAGLQRFAVVAREGCGAVETGAGEGLTAVLGSVVPGLTNVWRDALAEETGCRPLVLGPRLKTGMAIGCKNPGEVGADRVADAMAAKALVGAPAIVVHLEAATAITVVDKRGALAGGIIAPGFEASGAMLAQLAARLSQVEAVPPKHVVGKTTQEAIASGIFWGEVARVDGLVALVKQELFGNAEEGSFVHCSLAGNEVRHAPDAAIGAAGIALCVDGASDPEAVLAPRDVPSQNASSIPVLITGEGAAALASHLQCRPQLVPHLTLQGLALCA